MVSVTIDRRDGLNSAAAIKGPCRVATTANITLSGLQTIDGVALAEGDRVLCKDQTDARDNGIRIVSTGNWERSADFRNSRDIVTGTQVYVTHGTVSAERWYGVTAANPISVGTTNITFSQTTATVDLVDERAPSIVANTMLVDNAAGDAREAKTFAQVNEKLGTFETEAAASAATIDATINRVRLEGAVTLGDGLGGLYIDTDNGATDTFTSNGGTRTWYRVADVGVDRLAASSVALIDTKIAVRANAKTSATIRHVRDGTYIYDVITVKNPSAKLVRQEFGPDVASDGVVTRITPREYAQLSGAQIVVNACGFRAPDGDSWETDPQARPMGLSIANGILYQDWLAPETRTQAVVMMGDGTLTPAYKDDGISGADWVAAGAEWATGFGAFCVLSGAAVNLDATYMGTTISGRTVIGQKADGTVLLILIEGETSLYGASPTQCGTLALSLGCEIAYIMDGGGSTQCWWKNCYAVPSTDTAERALGSFIVVDADIIGNYDTGAVELPLEVGFSAAAAGVPGLSIRQINETIHTRFNVGGSFTTTPAVLHTNNFPARYKPTVVGSARGFVSGPLGTPGSVYLGDKFSGRAETGTLTYIAGMVSWQQKWTDLPLKTL